MRSLILANVALATSANTCLKLSFGDMYLTTVAILLNTLSFMILRFVLATDGLATMQLFLSSGMILSSVCTGMLLFEETWSVSKGGALLLSLSAILVNSWPDMFPSHTPILAR